LCMSGEDSHSSTSLSPSNLRTKFEHLSKNPLLCLSQHKPSNLPLQLLKPRRFNLMDILFSAIVGDLISRSASFVISRYFQQQHGTDKIVQKLHRLLMRIDTVVEGRRITNQGMLCQLKMLRQGMYRGHYMLDAFRLRPPKRFRASGAGSGSSNREAVLLSGANNSIQEELQRLVDTLEDTIAGMKEFLFFLESYPRILHQPYGTYLILDNCMFGRQTELERVLNFLLRPNAMPELAVLPIIGPIRVGKRTLIEYVCRDESARHHFSMILFFPEGSLKNEGLIDLCRIKHVVIQTLHPPRSQP
uniref:Rx N-terminal domain-containing protein n=2 Tax=Aegilops tauschii subsp. strangulata TaxID=200361 RepID=A0A453MSN0_AEGTS